MKLWTSWRIAGLCAACVALGAACGSEQVLGAADGDGDASSSENADVGPDGVDAPADQPETMVPDGEEEAEATPPPPLPPPAVLGRGLIAMPHDGGNVYLGWRFLRQDRPETTFNVYRRGEADAAWVGPINAEPIADSTNWVDETTESGWTYRYIVRPADGGEEGHESNEATVTAADEGRNYMTVPTGATQQVERLVPGDLDGDGLLDYIFIWSRDPTSACADYVVEARLHDGTLLWQYALGPGMAGWLLPSPFTVWDLEQDGMAEVILRTNPSSDPTDFSDDQVTVLDGMTGELKAQARWPAPVGGHPDDGTRNYLGIAHLDGRTPAIIAGRGTYAEERIVAYRYAADGLETVWETMIDPSIGQAAHGMDVADMDEDGNDEVFWGDVVLNEDGTVWWSASNVPYNGHPDIATVADIDPDSEGLEYFIANEAWTPLPTTGTTVYDRRGNVLWRDGGWGHIHVGFVGDILPERGMEMWASFSVLDESGERSGGIHSARGEVLEAIDLWPWMPVQWDQDPPKRLTMGDRLQVFATRETTRLPVAIGFYRSPVIADVFGDYREEIIGSDGTGANLYVYTNTEPIVRREVTALQDRKYRGDLARCGMQYQRQVFRGGYAMPEPDPDAAYVAGTVTDGTLGLGGVTIVATRGDDGLGEVAGFARTNSDGRFTLWTLVEGAVYTLRPQREGYRFAPEQRVVTLADRPLDWQDFTGTLESAILPAVETHGCSGHAYEFARVVVGDRHYVDRAYAVTSIPSTLSDHVWVRTAMDDKTCANDPLVVLTAVSRAEVLVGVGEGSPLPNWLLDWEDTGEVIEADHSPYGTTRFRLRRKSFDPGPVPLGPAGVDAGVMYLVLAH